MNKRRLVLILSLLVTAVLFVSRYAVTIGLCARNEYDCRYTFDFIEHISYFSIPVLLFSLLTFKSSETFSRWWSFAKFAIPVCLVLLLAINYGILETSAQGSFGFGGLINQAVNFWASAIVYSVFVIGSLIQIIRGYRAGKAGGVVGASS